MPFIEAAVASAKEDTLVPEGEYDLRISKVEEKESKKGNQMLQVMIDIEGSDIENPAPIFHYLVFPGTDDDARRKNMFLRNIRRFLEVFNIPFEDSGFNTDDLEGATGRCLVTQQEMMKDDQPTGEYSHALRLPKFANEPAEEETPARGGRRRRA